MGEIENWEMIYFVGGADLNSSSSRYL
jgi:hypothetical protein